MKFNHLFLTEMVSPATAFYYKHFTYSNFVAIFIFCLACAIAAGFLAAKNTKV
ncbi:hypothetical protein [Dyadobacter bucti]|uniref:hypothetical protein n=1 Tax=Dyadobacter bucti TaxID=2572203 RepID=UPI00140DA00E|nr:hypothetical protein [Dyadobacter bucti]